jgi:uncharacterized protein DUF285
MLTMESGGTYDFVVTWGDGSEDEIAAWDDPAVTHTYDNPGAYEVCVSGTIMGFRFADTDALDLTRTTDLSGAFAFCSSLATVPSMAIWDVAGVTDMSGMFEDAAIGDHALGSWDVRSVTDMSDMFQGLQL